MMAEYTTKKTYVANGLREMIVSGELRPGTRLRQQDIAEKFGVSPTPVREAIQQLESEGYLESKPHVGFQVADVRRNGLEEVYEIRSILEGRLAAQAAKRVSNADVDWLRTAAEEFASAAIGGDIVEARRVNYQLHRRIWEIADQPVTLEIVNSLWAKFPWDLLDYVPGRDERSVKEHNTLITALEARDPEGAEQALRDHISSGRADYMTTIAAPS